VKANQLEKRKNKGRFPPSSKR